MPPKFNTPFFQVLLESLAYYYDRVGSNLTKAKEFAEKFVLLVEKSVLDMKDILGRK
jgi:hypothetical protein